MSDTTYLAPGFLAVIYPGGNIRFPQLETRFQVGINPRLAAVELLNSGFAGDLDALAATVAQHYDKPEAGLKDFLQALVDSGRLSTTAPAKKLPNGGGPSHVGGGTVPDAELKVVSPVGLLSEAGQFLWYDHVGNVRTRMSLREMQAATVFVSPIRMADAWAKYRKRQHPHSLDETEFQALVTRLVADGMIAAAVEADYWVVPKYIGAVNREELQSLVDARVAAHDMDMAAKGRKLVPVVPVNEQPGSAPVSLGQVLAYAMEYDNGRLREIYDFVPMFLADEARVRERAAGTPGLFLFSNYVWSIETNLRLSALVKAVNPGNITIHGGPSTPKYKGDVEEYFANNPHVDICVRGEGEATFAAVLSALNPADPGNLDVLRDVAGVNYRSATGVVMTPDRERIADIDTIPSPILMGLFKEFGELSAAFVLETNRGCPYGCTFCDWGSSTLSKVRRFDLERVYNELEWCARHGVKEASIADANFGMLERDIDITKKIAELKQRYGNPRTVTINYAKNQVRYLRTIIEILAEAKILAEGVASLQSMDEQTLKVIDRSNIKLDKYTELSTEFRRARLPLAADIMMGLPGSTPESFVTDLQKCTDRDIRVRANPTQLLPNSPMNDPEYRKKHGIVAKPGEFLKETATYTRQQWEEMDRLRNLYCLLDTYGILRYVARFVRQETGVGEVGFYDRIRSEVLSQPEKYPNITGTLDFLEGYMGPLGSWSLFMEETRRYLITEVGIADDSALRTTLAVQLAHIPAAGRQFPLTLDVEHDFAAWQEAMFVAREAGHQADWQSKIPRLREFGPTRIVINDPNEICRRDVGTAKYLLDMNLRNWELDSPVARARLSNVAS